MNIKKCFDSSLIPYLSWFLIGGMTTFMDEIHIYFNIIDHSDNFIHKTFPFFFSPNYAIGGLLFYHFYILFTDFKNQIIKDENESFLGGKSFNLKHFIKQFFIMLNCYSLTGLLGSDYFSDTIISFITPIILISISYFNTPNLFRKDKIGFLASSIILGTSFEFIMGLLPIGFKYKICPSMSCLYSPIPILWLPCLYLCACSFIHSILRDS